MKKTVLFLSVFLMSLTAMSQQITGSVRDKKGKQLSGVTIKNVTTSNSTQTDDQGNFKIPGKPGEMLEARSIGFEPLKKPITSDVKITFILNETLSTLDEAVVIGYQTVSRKKLQLRSPVFLAKI
ncbi:carboxypeptidase-like regulatory domain-containing protein [Sphingobacterium sp. KU25419]|nr:carboxypeptidase-like regulatory domain-containing protein [Sphingobacterium sp. KU25419]